MDEKISLFCKEFKEKFGFDSRFTVFEAKVVTLKKSQFVEVLCTEGHFSSVIKRFYKLYFDNSPTLKLRLKLLPDTALLHKYGIANSGICPLYSAPSNKVEQVSQIIIGEIFDVLEISESGEWFRIRLHNDGYIGWVNKNPIKLITEKEMKKYKISEKIEITKKFTDVFEKPDKKSNILRGIFFGSELPVIGRQKEWLEVKLPDGNKGWLSEKACREVNDDSDHTKDLLKYANMLLGVPYIWGGRSPFGIDCSGFTQLVYKMGGYRIPRDSNMQFTTGIEIGKNFDDFLEGDLLFFGEKAGKVTHVGIYTGKDMEFIHASGFVRLNSLNKKSSRFHERLSNMFFGARRIINI